MALESKTVNVDRETGLSIFLSKDQSTKDRIVKNIILHFHGFPGAQKDKFSNIHKFFVEKGYMVVSFNYPGLWGTPGLFTPRGILDGIVQIIEFLIKLHPDSKYYIYGESFGGLAALAALNYLIKKVRTIYTTLFKAIAFRAPVPSFIGVDPKYFIGNLQDLVKVGILKTDENAWLDSEKELATKMDVENSLESLSRIPGTPNLMVHVGKNDEVLPFQGIVQTYQKFAELEIWDNLPHNAISEEKWITLFTKIEKFFQRKHETS